MQPDLKQMIKHATMAKVEADAQQRVLETVIADFFRVYIGTETEDAAQIKVAMGEVSTKLLAMQAAVMATKKRSAAMLGDLQRAALAAREQTLAAEKAVPAVCAVEEVTE